MTTERVFREYVEAIRNLIGGSSTDDYHGKTVRAKLRAEARESYVQVWVGGWDEDEYFLHALLPPQNTRNPSEAEWAYTVRNLRFGEPDDVIATGAQAFWAFDRFHVRLFPTRPDLRVKVQEVFE